MRIGLARFPKAEPFVKPSRRVHLQYLERRSEPARRGIALDFAQDSRTGAETLETGMDLDVPDPDAPGPLGEVQDACERNIDRRWKTSSQAPHVSATYRSIAARWIAYSASDSSLRAGRSPYPGTPIAAPPPCSH